jgi:hypothetical protein
MRSQTFTAWLGQAIKAYALTPSRFLLVFFTNRKIQQVIRLLVNKTNSQHN